MYSSGCIDMYKLGMYWYVCKDVWMNIQLFGSLLMRAAAGGRRKLAAGITLQCPPTSAIFPIKYFHSHLQLYFVQYLDLCEIEDWGTSVCSKAFKTPLSVWNFIDSGWFRFGGKKFYCNRRRRRGFNVVSYPSFDCPGWRHQAPLTVVWCLA